MTDDQYKALLNEVIAGREATNQCTRAVNNMRGELLRLEGAVTSLRGDVIVLAAEHDETARAVDKINARLEAVLQTVDGINHLAKSSYDMAASMVKEQGKVRQALGISDEQQQPKDAAG